jgi:hypothetical protein
MAATSPILANYPPARDLPYLADMARLEWAVDAAGRAADAAGSPETLLAALANVAAEQVVAQRFTLDPSCHFLCSAYPVLRIWQVHQPGFAGDVAVSFDAAADHLVVRREAGGVIIERLPPGDHALLRALDDGDDLATALDAAVAPNRTSLSKRPFAPASPTEHSRNYAATESIGEERRLTVASILRGAASMRSAVMSVPERAAHGYLSLTALVDRVQPFFAGALRIYVARVFFMSGLTKLHDWNITLALFRNEYHVPVLPPALAAVLGTGAELGLPVLLLLGCGTRIAAAALFVFNIIAVISYADSRPRA